MASSFCCLKRRQEHHICQASLSPHRRYQGLIVLVLPCLL
uniref:Uncharacterized protein n=1 Tax=Arundo donax TaxID=35708 RepID=A0A0A9GTV9_ARUDO